MRGTAFCGIFEETLLSQIVSVLATISCADNTFDMCSCLILQGYGYKTMFFTISSMPLRTGRAIALPWLLVLAAALVLAKC